MYFSRVIYMYNSQLFKVLDQYPIHLWTIRFNSAEKSTQYLDYMLQRQGQLVLHSLVKRAMMER